MCFISVPFVSGRTDRPYHNLSADLSKNFPLMEVMKQASKCARLFCEFPWEYSRPPLMAVHSQCGLTGEPSRGNASLDLIEELVNVDVDLLRFLLCVRMK